MKTIYRTYKIKLQPTEAQKVLLGKHFGCVRYVFNHFLNEKREQYKETKKSDCLNIQTAKLAQLKKKPETIWLKEINSQSLQFSLKCLDRGYVNFYRGNGNLPKFKSRKNKNTFTVPQRAMLKGNRLCIPKFTEGIKAIIHRDVNSIIEKCTIHKTPTGKYFAYLLVEEQYLPKEKTGVVCGIDLGLKDFAIISDGIKFKNNKYTKQYELKLSKAQKHLSRKKIKSTSFERQRRKVARLHEKVVNTRQDALHKTANYIIDKYDIICLENLNVRGMVSNRKLAKHISDASWGTFVRLLEYKSDWNDKKVVKIDRWFPSSKTCCECGFINKNLPLSIREWTCENGHVLDRDINAAKNILKEGLKILSAGAVDYTGGDLNKTTVKKRKSMNPETIAP